MMHRLDTIAIRQRKTRLRDAAFACSIALAAVISITSIGIAASAAAAPTAAASAAAPQIAQR